MAAADFDHDGWTDVALLANGKEGTTVWLYRNTRNPQQPFAKEPSAKFARSRRATSTATAPRWPTGTATASPDLILCKRGQAAGGVRSHRLAGRRSESAADVLE